MSIRTVEFWPVYKHLEKEVLELSYSVQFNDQHFNVYSLKIPLWLSSTNMVTKIHMTYTCVSRILRFNYPLFSNFVEKYICLKSNSLTYNTKHVYSKTAVMLSNCQFFIPFKGYKERFFCVNKLNELSYWMWFGNITIFFSYKLGLRTS